MRKIFIGLTVILSMFIIGCGNSLDIPKIEGTYEKLHTSDDGTILTKNSITIDKIGKNKYSIKVEAEGKYPDEIISAYQEVEILEVKKDREKSPSYYTFEAKELTQGKGVYQRRRSKDKEYETTQISKVKLFITRGTSFSFQPKSATEQKEKISVPLDLNLDGNSARVFWGTRIN